jgi:excisionase family DNA binding protein
MFDLLNQKEAAQALRISIHTLRAWTFQRKVPVVKLGRRVLYRKKDLEDMIEKGRITNER